MPLNLLLHEDNHQKRPMIVLDSAYDELRFSIIGNKDLKYKLVGNVQFIKQLTTDFEHLINQLTEATNVSLEDTSYLLENLEKLAVITNILCLFSIEVDNKKDENIAECLSTMKLVLNPIIRLLNYFIQSFVPALYRHKENPSYLDIQSKFESVIGYALEILMGLANIKDHGLDTKMLWRFIISLLIVTDDNHEQLCFISSSILIKSLKLVPLLLGSTCRVTNDSLETLLTALLNRLSKKCDTIINTHITVLFPSSSDQILHQMAFEDSCLPNIDLNKSILEKTVDSQLLLEFITCTAQILSFMKSNDYDILTAFQSNYVKSPNEDKASKKKRKTSFSNKTREFAFNVVASSTPVIVLSVNVYLALLLLVKYDNWALNLASLNLIAFYLKNLKPSQDGDKALIFRSYKKLFPRIISMLELKNDYTGCMNKKTKNPTSSASGLNSMASFANKIKSLNQTEFRLHDYQIPMFLLSPTRILSDLCLQYPRLNDDIHDTNIDYKLVEKLQICYQSSKLLKILKSLKSSSNHGKMLVDFTTMLTIDKDETEVSDLLLLLSVYTANREEYRTRVVNVPQEYNINVAEIIFEIVDDYYFLLNQLHLAYRLLSPKKRRNLNGTTRTTKEVPDSDLPWFGRNLGIISTLHDASIFTNCFYFIRSVSRSVATLRTFFVECNSFKSFSTTDDATDNEQQPSGQASLRSGNVGENSANNADSLTIRTTASAPRVTSGANTNSNSNAAVTSSSAGSTSVTNGPPGGFIFDILQIIHKYEILMQIFEFFYGVNNTSDNYDHTEMDIAKCKKIVMTNKSICIGSLANFILDFSSFRYKIIGHESFLSSLLTIYQNSSTDNEIEESIPITSSKGQSTLEEIYQNNDIQLKILQVIKNFMYNEATENKKEVLDCFSLNFILQKASYGLGDNNESISHHKSRLVDNTHITQIKLQQKITAFEILRNFISGSPHFNALLIDAYENDFVQFEYANGNTGIPNTWFQFLIQNVSNVNIFLPDLNYKHNASGRIRNPEAQLKLFYENDEVLSKLIQDEKYVRLIRAINHTEDHKYSVIDKSKRNWFPNDGLLKIWLRLLSFKIPESILDELQNDNDKVNLFNNLYSIQSSIIWIIVNLTWKYSRFGYNVHDYSKYDVYQNVDGSRFPTSSNHRIYIDEDDDQGEDVIMDDPSDMPEPQQRQQQDTTSSSARISSSRGNEKRKLEGQTNTHESSVYERAKHLDEMGFTQVIKQLIKYYTDQANDNLFNKSSPDESRMENVSVLSTVLFGKGHDILEKLDTALRQITALLNTKTNNNNKRGRDIGVSGVDGHPNNNNDNNNDNSGYMNRELRLQIDGDNVSIIKKYSDEDIERRANQRHQERERRDNDRYQISQRREAIDSEDNDDDDDDDDEEMEVDQDQQQAGGGAGGDDDDGDFDYAVEANYEDRDDSESEASDEIPDEYWIM
ncbi:hypothetical protein MEM_00994 [Candida albicans L26]|nr:hypothetical protein MEM_00994 [Candida albicans L26]